MALTRYFYDTADVQIDTVLTSRVPEQGTGWQAALGNGGTNARCNAADGTIVQPFYSPAAASYYRAIVPETVSLEQQVVARFNTVTARLLLRCRDGSSGVNCISVEFSSALNRIELYSVTESVKTLVDTASAGGDLVSLAVCKAHISATNEVSVYINNVLKPWTGAGNSIVVNGHDSGTVGWLGVKSYTAGGADNFEGWYVTAGGPQEPLPITEGAGFGSALKNSLATAGYTGSLNDSISKFLQASVSNADLCSQDMMMQWLASKGYTGTLNDRLYAYAIASGYKSHAEHVLSGTFLNG